MIKEKYEKPFMEIIDLKNDTIDTIVTSITCNMANECASEAISCSDDCAIYYPYCPGYCPGDGSAG